MGNALRGGMSVRESGVGVSGRAAGRGMSERDYMRNIGDNVNGFLEGVGAVFQKNGLMRDTRLGEGARSRERRAEPGDTVVYSANER